MPEIVGRTRNEKAGRRHIDLPINCLCLRPRQVILCNICGFFMFGRIKISCPVHPQTVFLNDLGQCPKCRAYMLTEVN